MRTRSSRRYNCASSSQWFGEVGKRGVFLLTVSRVYLHDSGGQYGPTTIVSFLDPSGNQAVWFASGDKREGLEVGRTYHVTATVKAHGNDRRDQSPQTVLTRAVLVAYDPSAPPPEPKVKRPRAPAGEVEWPPSGGTIQAELAWIEMNRFTRDQYLVAKRTGRGRMTRPQRAEMWDLHIPSMLSVDEPNRRWP